MKKYSKDGLVCFDPLYHTYYLGNKKLQSVTSYIGQYKNPFDSDRIATAFAKKHGLDKETVLLNWKLKSELSCSIGTACHKVFEDYINTGEIILSGIHDKELIAKRFIQEIFETKKLTPIETEYIVYGDNLAGQLDCIVKNNKNEYFIIDWKTNDKIDKTSFAEIKMFPPYTYLQDCSYSHYSLQLSIYKQLVKEYKIKDCYVVHINSRGYEFLKTPALEKEGVNCT